MRDDHLLPLPELDTWRNNAARRGHDTALWFEPTRQAEGLAICATCPVQDPCAIAGRNEEGVWGGVSEGHNRTPTKPGRRAGTHLTLTCSECRRAFLYVTKGAGILPVCCGYRCRQDRNLRLAREARARRDAS